MKGAKHSAFLVAQVQGVVQGVFMSRSEILEALLCAAAALLTWFFPGAALALYRGGELVLPLIIDSVQRQPLTAVALVILLLQNIQLSRLAKGRMNKNDMDAAVETLASRMELRIARAISELKDWIAENYMPRHEVEQLRREGAEVHARLERELERERARLDAPGGGQ